MNNPISLAYSAALVANQREIPPHLKRIVNQTLENDFIALVQSNNTRLLRDLHYAGRISPQDANILLDWITEFGTCQMCQCAIDLGYTPRSTTLSLAVEIGDVKKVKLLFRYLNSRDLIEDDELTGAYNVAVSENYRDVITFLNRFELNTRDMTPEARKVYSGAAHRRRS